MTEAALMRRIHLALSRETRTTAFRNNVGRGWAGDVTIRDGTATVRHARALNAGLCEGSSDLIGWTEVIITPDMVGKRVAVFTGLEVKTPGGRASAEQKNFRERVTAAGGIAAVVRSVDDAIAAVRMFRGAK